MMDGLDIYTIYCDVCEAQPATMLFRSWRGPRAFCELCFSHKSEPKEELVIPMTKEEYVEEHVIDKIMEQ